jgi:prepilin-type N-terminal cleavage/methylation domain-containing protein
MGAAMIRRSGDSRAQKQRGQSGFALVEVMVSMVLLTVALVSLAGVFGLAMAATQTTQQDMIAKQLANEAYESIVTARNTAQLNWDQIQNLGSTDCPITGATTCGIFLVGPQPIYNAGADGIYGTSDDAAAGEQTLHEPGPDGIFGTADDVYITLTGYQRTIALANVDTTLRSITITVQYTATQAALARSYVLNSYISEYQ